LEYKEVQTKGWLGRLYAVTLKPDEVTITWPIYDAEVWGPFAEGDIDASDLFAEENLAHHLEIDRPLVRPLHFPVCLIDYAHSYAH